MLMLYNSDQFAVVQFQTEDEQSPARGGYEIVDKFARKQIVLEGEMEIQFKAGVDALTKGLALEVAPYGVRVNAILPGLMETPMAIEQRVRALNADWLAGRIPRKRYASASSPIDGTI